MNYQRLWAPLRILSFAVLVTLSSGFLLALPADAQGTARPFVQDQFYQGAGNEPPTLEQFAIDPMTYLRSSTAYAALRAQFARALSVGSLSETEFKALFANGHVRATKLCTGQINTDGILPSGQIVSNTRGCYAGERLIELNVQGNWVVVASQGCFNSSRLVRAPQPPAKVCRWVDLPNTYEPGRVFSNPGLNVRTESCGCGIDIDLPGSYFVRPGQTVGSAELVCE